MTFSLTLPLPRERQPSPAGTIYMKPTMDADGNWYRAPFIRDEHGDRPLHAAPIDLNAKPERKPAKC